MICNICGKQITEDAVFCNYCGARNGAVQVNANTPPPRFNGAYAPPQNVYEKPKKKKRKGCLIIFLAVIAVLITVLALNGGSINVSTIRIIDAKVASQIDEETKKAVTVTNIFNTDSPVVYVSVEVRNAPEGSKAGADWIFADTSYKIASVEVDLMEINQQAYFSLTKPNNGFPIGKYEVKLYLDGKYDSSVNFEVK